MSEGLFPSLVGTLVLLVVGCFHFSFYVIFGNADTFLETPHLMLLLIIKWQVAVGGL